MRKTRRLALPAAVSALLGGLLLGGLAPMPASAAPGDGFTVTGDPIETVDLGDEGTDGDELAELTGGLQAVDPGRYQLELGSEEGGKIAAVRKDPGSSLWITLVVRLPEDAEFEDSIHLTVGTPDGTECGSTEVDISADGSVYTGPAPVGLLIDPETVDSSSQPACMGAEELLIGAAHEPDSENALSPLSAELLLIEEPSAARIDELAEEPDSDVEFEPSWPTDREAEPVEGGAGFGEAPALRPGRYADSIEPGGSRLYRVDADWGQSVQATANFAPLSAGEAAQLPDQELGVGVSILGPNRQPVARAEESLDDESEVLLGARTPPVQYRNRESSSSEVASHALAGAYYVLVTAPDHPDVPALGMEYELDLIGRAHV